MEEKEETLYEKLAKIKEQKEKSKSRYQTIIAGCGFVFSLVGWSIVAYVDWRLAIGLFFVLWGENINRLIKTKK